MQFLHLIFDMLPYHYLVWVWIGVTAPCWASSEQLVEAAMKQKSQTELAMQSHKQECLVKPYVGSKPPISIHILIEKGIGGVWIARYCEWLPFASTTFSTSWVCCPKPCLDIGL